MELTLTFERAKYGKAVHLRKTLPSDRGFGNDMPIAADRKGYITSQGFEAGMLRVLFSLHPEGDIKTQFNELNAREYLTVDIY